MVIALGKLIGGIVLGAGRVQRVTDSARPRARRTVAINLWHLESTVQDLLRHTVERKGIHGRLVHGNLCEDGVDPSTLRSEGLVDLTLDGQELTLVQVVRVAAEDHDEAVLEMHGRRW